MVIAMIAVLAAALLPVLQSTTERSDANQCRVNLTRIGAALRMYRADSGDWPLQLRALYDTGLITDRRELICVGTGEPYYYFRPGAQTPDARVVVSCCPPNTPEGERPHDRGRSFLALKKSGDVVEMRGPVP